MYISLKTVAILSMLLTLLATGCGPSKEEQYNTLRTEVLKLTDETRSLDRNLTWGKETPDLLRKHQAANEQMRKGLPAVEEKLKKMEELSKGSVQLSDDCRMIRTRTEGIITGHIKHNEELIEKIEYKLEHPNGGTMGLTPEGKIIFYKPSFEEWKAARGANKKK